MMGVPIQAYTNETKVMVMGDSTMLMEVIPMKGISKMEGNTALESMWLQINSLILGIINLVYKMVKELRLIIQVINTLEAGLQERNKDM